MEDNIINQAEHSLDVFELQRATEQLKDFIPSMVELNKSIYEEMKRQGFNEVQAFNFSCQYVLKSIFQGK